MKESLKEHFGRWGWAIVSYLGCILLLIGNSLPWPCIALDARDCSVLITFNLNDSWYGILLVAALLLIPLEVNLLKSPLNYVCWFSFWLLIFLLIGPSLYPVTIDSKVWFYLPLVTINHNMAGPSSLVMPLSLITLWLVIRPKNLQMVWRFGTIVGLVVLMLLTGFFFISLGQSVNRFALSPSPFPEMGIFGSGPLLILIGGVLLLGSVFFEMRRDRKKAAPEEATNA